MEGAIHIAKGTGVEAGRVSISCGPGRCVMFVQDAKAFARALRCPANSELEPVPQLRVICTEEGKVRVLLQGNIWFASSQADARRISDVIRHIAGQVEEELDAPRLIDEQALALRSNFPYDVTAHPGILAEAKKEAEFGSIRRYLPLAPIAGLMRLGTPTVRPHPPGAFAYASDVAETGTASQRAALLKVLEERS